MQILINIPKEFEEHFNSDKFEDSLQRVRFDIHEAIIAKKDVLLSGNYEIEILDMLTETLIKALEQEPCEDCVSRAELKKIAKKMYLEVANMELDVHTISDCISYTSSKCRQVLERELEAISSVTPQLKIEHWIERAQYSDGKHKIECSECGNHIFDRGHANSFNVKNKYKYCPNCGAKMESEDKEHDLD